MSEYSVCGAMETFVLIDFFDIFQEIDMVTPTNFQDTCFVSEYFFTDLG